MADHSNGEHRVIESSTGSVEGSRSAAVMEKSPSRSKKYRKVSIFKKSASHDDGGVSKGSGRGKRKGSKEKKSEGQVEVHDILEQSTTAPIPEILAASPVQHNHHYSDSEVNHYEIHTQDHEEKSTGDLSVKQLQKLNKELAKQRKSMDALKRDRENLLNEKAKLKSENKSLEKVLKRGGSKSDVHRLSKKQSVEDGLGSYADEMKFRIKELEDQLAERDYKITALRLTIEKNSELHSSLGSDSTELESDRPTAGGGGKRVTNGGILDSTAALERLLEEQDMSLKLRRENAELRSQILAMDAEWERCHKDSDPSPKSPRKRSSGFFKRGKKSTSSMPSRRVSEETAPHDGARSLKRSPSPDIGGGGKLDAHQEVEISDFLLLSRLNKESSSSLPCYGGSPNQSPQMAVKSKTGADLGTLQACLKLALSEKTLFEESNAALQKELESAKEKMKELEKSLEAKMEETVAKLQKKVEVAEIDRDTYRDELKISQQELEEMLEKQKSSEKLHLETLKTKDSRIKELEEKLESMKKKTPPSSTYGEHSTNPSPRKPSASESTAFNLGRSSSKEASNTNSAPQSITSPTQPKDTVSPTRISSTTSSSTTTNTQGTSNAAKASGVTSPTRFSGSKDITSPTRSTIVQSPTKASSEVKVIPSSSSTQTSDTPKQSGLVRKLSRELSSEKLSGQSPSTNSTKKIGKLSRESSIDKFEVQKEPQAPNTKRKNSNAGIPPPSPSSNFAKVAATRAMFEQKIDQTKTSNVPGRRQLKSSGDSVDEKRRSSLGGNSASAPDNKPRTTVMHSKSNSYDFSLKPPSASPKTSTTTIPEVVPNATGTSRKSGNVPPTSEVRSMPNGPASVTNDDRNKSDHLSRQQQEKKSSSVSVSSSSVTSKSSSDSVFSSSTRGSSASTRGSSPTKVSKITITSTASPTNSPLPSGRKEMAAAAKVGQGSNLLIRNPTSPCLGGTKRTPSPTSSSTRILCGQLSSPAKMGGPTRKFSSSSCQSNEAGASSGSSAASSSSSSDSVMTQSSSKSQAPVRKQQSQVVSSWSKTEKPSSSVSAVSSTKPRSSSISSNSSSSSSSTPSTSNISRPSTIVTSNTSISISSAATTATSPTNATVYASSSSNKNGTVVSGQKSSSSSLEVSNSKLTSPVAKMGSLQNIQSYINGTSSEESKNSASTAQSSSGRSSHSSSSTTTSSSSTVVTASSGVKKGPTPRIVQRRDRKDRSKTMYAGRAETTNLVNLISKFQAEEKEKKLMSTSVVSSQSFLTPSATTPTLNGSSSLTTSSTVVGSSSVTAMSSVTRRQHSPGNTNRPRPATFYIADSSPSSNSNVADKSSSSSSFSSKPPPHERRLMRSQTTYGMGNNRMSKKAMLLRWCQVMTQGYENVNICNFAESFSNGLAFCALMHHFLPDQIPFNTLSASSRERNFKIAFKAAEGAGIPSLLDVEDMVSLPIPDWMSVMTYVSFIYNKFGQDSQQQQQNQSSMV